MIRPIKVFHRIFNISITTTNNTNTNNNNNNNNNVTNIKKTLFPLYYLIIYYITYY